MSSKSAWHSGAWLDCFLKVLDDATVDKKTKFP